MPVKLNYTADEQAALAAAKMPVDALDERLADAVRRKYELDELERAYRARPGVEAQGWGHGDHFYGSSPGDEIGRQLAADHRAAVDELAELRKQRNEAWSAFQATERRVYLASWARDRREGATEDAVHIAAYQKAKEARQAARLQRRRELDRIIDEAQPGLREQSNRLMRKMFGLGGGGT